MLFRPPTSCQRVPGASPATLPLAQSSPKKGSNFRTADNPGTTLFLDPAAFSRTDPARRTEKVDFGCQESAFPAGVRNWVRSPTAATLLTLSGNGMLDHSAHGTCHAGPIKFFPSAEGRFHQSNSGVTSQERAEAVNQPRVSPALTAWWVL